MKKTWALAAFLVVFSLLLTGCACEHRWLAADCLQPQICEECREVGAPALGHDWREATCVESKTCARCGVTEGEALGHSLGSWTFTQEQMTRACDRCGFAETAQTDRELYLQTLLPGNWYLYGVVQGENYSFAAHMGFTEVRLSFDGERNVTFTTPEGITRQGTWVFDTYREEEGIHHYSFTLQCPGETYSLRLKHNLIGNVDLPEKSILVSVGEQEFQLSQYAQAEQTLVADWGIKTGRAGGPLGNPGNWITFREDRTVTGNLNGAVEGVWHIVPRFTQNMLTPSSYRIVIENHAREETQWMEGVLYIEEDAEYLELSINRSVQTFAPTDGQTLALIQNSTRIPLGTWTSTECSYLGETVEYTDAYSVTFYEDGTFTADLGGTQTGNWIGWEVPDPASSGHPTTYLLYMEGAREPVTCEIDTQSEPNQLVIFDCPEFGGQTFHFFRIGEADAADHAQGLTYLVGDWTSEFWFERTVAPHDWYGEENFTGDYTVTFREDGTFTMQLEEETAGTWEYLGRELVAEEEGKDIYAWEYQITIAEQVQYLEVWCEEQYPIRIAIPHPQNPEREIVYAFSKDE